jgi:beta-N-acetylhexosaminidase
MGAMRMELSAQPTPSEIASVTSVASDGRIVIVATSDVAKNTQQAQLVAALEKINAPTIVVAMRSPYDLLHLKDVSTYLTIYGANPPMLEALAEVLLGKIPASGKLPVEF